MPHSFDEQDAPVPRPKRASRQRSRRRRRPRSYPLQLLGAATLVAGILFVAVIVVEKAVHPYWLGHQVGQEVATLQSKLRAQQQRNAALRQEVRYLKSDEGAEVLARRAGYHRPGEQVLLLTNAPPATTPAAPRARQQQP